MSSQGLTAKVTLTANAAGLVGAAAQGTAALDTLRNKALEAGAAGVSMGSGFDAGAVAIGGMTAASAASTAALNASGAAKVEEIANLKAMAAAGTQVTATITAISAAHATYNNEVNQARTLLAQGVIGQTQYGEAVVAASARLALAQTAANDASLGIKAVGEEAEGAAAGGLSHMTLAVERLGASTGVGLMSMREMAEIVRGVGEAAVSVEGLIVIGLVASVAAIAGLVVAEDSYLKSLAQVDVAAEAHGNILGQTRQQYLDLAQQISATAQVSDSAGRGIAAAFLNNNVNPNAWDAASAAARGYAVITGKTVPEAAAALAAALQDPAKGVQQLNTEYNLLNDASTQLIIRLVAQGDIMDAQTALADAIKNSFAGLRGEVTLQGSMWDVAKQEMAIYFDSLGQEFHAASPYIMALPALLTGQYLPIVKSLQLAQAALANPPDLGNGVSARLDQESRAVGDLIRSYDVYGTALQKISDDRAKEEKVFADGAISLTTLNKALALDETKEAQIKKQQLDATLNLNEGLKAQLERIKELIQNSPQVIAQAKLEADTNVELAQHVNDSTLAKQKFTDQLAIDKTTLPYATALLYVHGVAADKLRTIIASLTSEMQKNEIAQHYTDDSKQVDSQFLSLSGPNVSDALMDAQLQKTTQNLTDQKNAYLADGAAAFAMGYTTLSALNDYNTRVNYIFSVSLADAYKKDLDNRKDWSSGVQSGLNQLMITQDNWAAKSKQDTLDAAQSFEDGFVDAVLKQKDPLQAFFDWFAEAMLKMAYEASIGQTMAKLAGGIVGQMGSLFGLGDGVDPVVVTPPVTLGSGGGLLSGAGNFISSLFNHTGGVIGQSYSGISMQNAALWTGAPRFHSGGEVGLKPGERRIVAQDGEHIYTEQQNDALVAAVNRPLVINMPAAANGNSGGAPIINITNTHPDAKVTQKSKQNGNGQWSFDFLVSQVSTSMAANSRSGNDPLTSMLESTHGLKRRPG